MVIASSFASVDLPSQVDAVKDVALLISQKSEKKK